MIKSIAIPTVRSNEVYIKTWQLFFIVTALSILISLAFQKAIMTRAVFYNLYSAQMEAYRIDDYISLMKKFQIWGYIATPLIVWFRIAFVAFLIQLPFMLKYIELSFKDVFRIVTLAYFILLLADVTRLFYLYFQPIDSITIDSLSFIPLSLTNILNKSNYSEAIFALFSKINLFELIWGVIIYLGLKKTKMMENIDYVLIVFGVWIGIAALTFGLTLFIGTFA